MKLILELNEEDIDSQFKESYDEHQIRPYKLESHHFNDQVMNIWNDVDEIWFYRKEYIGDTEKIKLK